MDDENPLIAERRAKLAKLRAAGVAFPNDFRRDALAEDLHAAFGERDDDWLVANPTPVKVGGRMMFKRVMGKASFAKLADRSGQIQLFLQAEALGSAYEDFKSADVGDIPRRRRRAVPDQDRRAVRARDRAAHAGEVAAPAAGQVARHRGCRHPLSATLSRPDHDRGEPRGVSHPRPHRALPARLPGCARLLEVETPIMQPIPGGAAARPFITHYNALDIDVYLRIAPELYLKRLVVGGFERVYELNRVFRNEGLSTRHNPEFTMLELYLAYGNYEDLMDWAEKALRGLAHAIKGGEAIEYQGRAYDLSTPFRRVTVEQAIIERNPELDPTSCETSRHCGAPVIGWRYPSATATGGEAAGRDLREDGGADAAGSDLRVRLSGGGITAVAHE